MANDAVDTNNLRPKSISNTKIQRGAVRSFQVKNRSVTGRDVKNKSLTRRQIAAHTITGGYVKDQSLTGKQIDVSTLPLTGVAERFTAFNVTIGSSTPAPLSNPTGLGPGASIPNQTTAWTSSPGMLRCCFHRRVRTGARRAAQSCS